jgi:hypothetical protein
MEGMNQTGVQYMYTWKDHNEAPCLTKHMLRKTFLANVPVLWVQQSPLPYINMQNVPSFHLVLVCSAGNQTQSPIHARQALNP